MLNETVCAILVTYNRKHLLRECLDSLLKQTVPLDCIVIIDNASSDGSELFIRDYLSMQHITYIRMKENLGGAGGFYEGIKWAASRRMDFIWMMDDDVILEPTALAELLEAKNKLQDFGFLCSRVLSPFGVEMNVPEVDVESIGDGYPQWGKFLSDAVIQIRSATFVSVFVPVHVVRQVGLPIKEMFIWGDDVEYTLRISSRYKCFLVGRSLAIHKRSIASRLKIRNETSGHRIRNYFYYYRNNTYNYKTYRKREQFALFVFDSLKLALKFMLPPTKNSMLKAAVILKGILLGILFHPEIKYP